MSDLIDKAEAQSAVRAYLVNESTEIALHVEQIIAALPARGVGVTWHPFDTAPRDGSRFLAQGGGLDAIDICSYNARVGCWDCGSVTLDDTDHEPEGYNRPAQWMPLAALAPTDAAQARESALREAAATWEAFKAATTTADHFAAVERLDAIFGETRK